MSGYSRGVREVMTRWAENYSGGCGHSGLQFSGPGDLRSGCRECARALDGWDGERACDLCGALCRPGGAWSWPPELTGDVAVLLAACDSCDVYETDDPEEGDMKLTTRNGVRSGWCRPCREEFVQFALQRQQRRALAAAGVHIHEPHMHQDCHDALLAGLAGLPREAELGLSSRIAVKLALHELRSAS